MIHAGLLTCINKFYGGWDINPNEWMFSYYTGISPRSQSRNSGFYTLYYSREFHDGKLQRSLDSGSITALRKDLLYQLLTMEGNYAELPSHIARYLE
ncbi:hypothetical protein DAI22_05g261900 [Oryza sativa Japonica Group]|jgi:hypothetical protein|nr:hypothetical protein DAI22_05g261900 [Oryza sativa Japonica Group]